MAVSVLQKATLASGEFEHPLTAIAHLELGRLAMAAGDYSAAAAHFEEASYASYYFTDVNHVPDLGVMEEAFRYGALNHLLANGKGIFPPLAVAAVWAKTNHCRQLYVSLLTLAAENHLVMGQTQQAMALLDDARIAIGNKTIANGRLAFRRLFLTATALYQARKPADGDAILAKAMHFMRTGSLWLFQMQKVDEYYMGGGSGGVNPARAAIDLYQAVLRDPQPADWLTDPMESLALLCVPHGLIFEHWFEAAVARKDHELAIEVADRARRHRFLCTLPLGGRLESLRWVLEAPKELLPPQALIQRQELLSRYPAYKDLLDQAEALRRELAALPLVLSDAEKTKKQGQAMAEFMDDRPQAGNRPARDGRAPRSGGDRLSPFENDGRDPEIAAAGPRPADLLRHQPEPVRLSAEPRQVCQLASRADAAGVAGPRPASGRVASRNRQHLAELRALVEGPVRRQVAANRPGTVGRPAEGLAAWTSRRSSTS